MDFQIDAFPVDDSVNGIRSTEKIKIAICYILASIDEGLSRNAMQATLYDNGIANYFEISQAIDDLLKVEALIEDDVLSLTEKGKKIAADLEDQLSIFIKNKAVRAARLTLLYEKRQRETKAEIIKLDDKKYRLDLSICSGLSDNDELISLSLYLTDYTQATVMKNSFINNPSRLYENVIEGLTSDPTFTE